MTDAEKWAVGMQVPAYAIDDQTAIKVTDGTVDPLYRRGGQRATCRAEQATGRGDARRRARMSCQRSAPRGASSTAGRYRRCVTSSGTGLLKLQHKFLDFA
jgi:hypothetical protein